MAEIKIEDIKPNSHKYKEEMANKESEKPERDVKAIVQAHKKKKGLGEKFAESFVKEDRDSVKEYVLFDVIIPAVKDIASDVITGAVDMLLYGETRGRGRSRRSSRNSTRVSYEAYYRNGRSSSSRSRSKRDERKVKDRYDEIIFDTRNDAEDVLDRLVDLIEADGEATVADLYDLSGITADFSDEGWGWTNLASAKVRKDRYGGWYIDFPKPRGL